MKTYVNGQGAKKEGMISMCKDLAVTRLGKDIYQSWQAEIERQIARHGIGRAIRKITQDPGYGTNVWN
jgi:hypothetical protein